MSQLLNEYFAKEAGLEDWQLGLGHAFEINPELPETFRLELAHALLARQLFPDAPLKWMPPTKHMTGDVFRGYLLDGFFNLVGAMTGQGILLVGMMTEAVVTPLLSDRDLALQNVRYVLNAAGGLTEDFHPPRDGLIQTRARQVLGEAVDLLERIVSDTDPRHCHPQPLLAAIADGTFGSMKRPPTEGKGLDGVVEKARAERVRQPGRRAARETGSHPMTRPQPTRLARSCAPTATPPATAWCRCRSPCRCRTTSAPRAQRSSSPPRWAWSRPCWCTPRRWGRTSPSSSSTARSPTSSTCARSRWSSASTRC